MRLTAAAMNAALRDFKALRYSTQVVSMMEAFLVAKRMEATGAYPDPTINDANRVVGQLFNVLPTEELGRIYPFRYDWLAADQSGRKTVWNNTTRGKKLATSIFQNDQLREGLRSDAASVIAARLAAVQRPSKQAVITLLLRDHLFDPMATWDSAEQELLQYLSLSQAEFDLVADNRPIGVSLLGGDEWSPGTLDESLTPQVAVAVSTAQVVAAPGGSESLVGLGSRRFRDVYLGTRYPTLHDWRLTAT